MHSQSDQPEPRGPAFAHVQASCAASAGRLVDGPPLSPPQECATQARSVRWSAARSASSPRCWRRRGRVTPGRRSDGVDAWAGRQAWRGPAQAAGPAVRDRQAAQTGDSLRRLCDSPGRSLHLLDLMPPTTRVARNAPLPWSKALTLRRMTLTPEHLILRGPKLTDRASDPASLSDGFHRPAAGRPRHWETFDYPQPWGRSVRRISE